MSKTLWEFDDSRQMLLGLVGPTFGAEPEKRIDDVREEKRSFAAQIVQKSG